MAGGVRKNARSGRRAGAHRCLVRRERHRGRRLVPDHSSSARERAHRPPPGDRPLSQVGVHHPGRAGEAFDGGEERRRLNSVGPGLREPLPLHGLERHPGLLGSREAAGQAHRRRAEGGDPENLRRDRRGVRRRAEGQRRPSRRSARPRPGPPRRQVHDRRRGRHRQVLDRVPGGAEAAHANGRGESLRSIGARRLGEEVIHRWAPASR